MEKKYLYYNSVLQFRIEVQPDGTLGAPEKIGGFTNQMNGQGSLPMQKTKYRVVKKAQEKKEEAKIAQQQLKVAEETKKKDEVNALLDKLKMTVGEVQYDD